WRGGGDVDPASSVAPGLDGLGQIDAEGMRVAQADDAGAVDRALDVARKPGDERIGFAAAPEEGHVHAVDVVLVNKHGHVPAILEHAHEFKWRVEAGRDEIAHAAFAELNDRIAHRADIRPAVEEGRVDAIPARKERPQFPLCTM